MASLPSLQTSFKSLRVQPRAETGVQTFETQYLCSPNTRLPHYKNRASIPPFDSGGLC